MLEDFMIFPIIAIAIIIIIYAAIAAKKRTEAMSILANQLGLSFFAGKNRGIAHRYSFLNKMRAGRDRYAYNMLAGRYHGYNVCAFDYHYKTGYGKNTQHHNLSLFILHLPTMLPELVITKEHIFSKIGQALGYDDIDFESHEFSRKFCVRSRIKKFAYDFCNAKMIEYLIINDDLSIEVDSNVLFIFFQRRLAPEYIEPNLNRLITIRSLMPEYLFSGR